MTRECAGFETFEPKSKVRDPNVNAPCDRSFYIITKNEHQVLVYISNNIKASFKEVALHHRISVPKFVYKKFVF